MSHDSFEMILKSLQRGRVSNFRPSCLHDFKMHMKENRRTDILEKLKSEYTLDGWVRVWLP